MSLDLVTVVKPLFNDPMKRRINPTVCFLKMSLCGMSSSHILDVEMKLKAQSSSRQPTTQCLLTLHTLKPSNSIRSWDWIEGRGPAWPRGAQKTRLDNHTVVWGSLLITLRLQKNKT